jgi:hypothetical protein
MLVQTAAVLLMLGQVLVAEPGNVQATQAQDNGGGGKAGDGSSEAGDSGGEAGDDTIAARQVMMVRVARQARMNFFY